MKQRYFGTYKGEIVEYYPPYGCDKIVLLKRDGLLGECVELSNIPPSPYPWQFHTREFWDAHPGMRWAYRSTLFSGRWFLSEEKPVFNDGYWEADRKKIIDGLSDLVSIAASLFENPFFRNYPAELDDPLWWRDNAPKWATCGSWDFDHSSRPFYFYAAAPRKQRGEIKVKSWSCVGKIWRHVDFDGRYTGTWEDCPLIMRPAAKVPLESRPEAAPKRAGTPLSVKYAGREGIRFFAITERAQNWLNEQAPMFGRLSRIDTRVFWLTTDTPHAAMRYLVDGFYNRQPDVIRKHYPSATAEPESGPRTEKRTISHIIKGESCHHICFDGSKEWHEVTRATVLSLMKGFGIWKHYSQLMGKTITVRIDADKLVIVED